MAQFKLIKICKDVILMLYVSEFTYDQKNSFRTSVNIMQFIFGGCMSGLQNRLFWNDLYGKGVLFILKGTGPTSWPITIRVRGALWGWSWMSLLSSPSLQKMNKCLQSKDGAIYWNLCAAVPGVSLGQSTGHGLGGVGELSSNLIRLGGVPIFPLPALNKHGNLNSPHERYCETWKNRTKLKKINK